MKKFFIALLFPFIGIAQNKPAYPFQNTSLGFEARVNDLVGRLTLEEKVAQMLNATPAVPRLGIPAYDWWNEVLHGVARTEYKVTVYPQAIGMAATFDTASIRRMAEFSATEGRAIFNAENKKTKPGSRYTGLTYWTPNINIFRDPRWGRGQETYGEDPFLTATMGRSFVQGLQGNDPKYLHAAACAKHYAIHSGPESSRHSFNAVTSRYDLWNTYLPAFKELVVNAKVAGVMCAYNAFQNQPCCGNDELMTHILRDEWAFTGYVTSDCGAIDDFFNFHKTHPNATAAAADALLHGTDIDCGNTSYKALLQAVKQGKITEKQMDVSLKRLFMIRFRLGMFDPPSMVKYANTPLAALESPAHAAQALQMARQSIVLLKNENQTLPLSKKLKKIVVLGPNADNNTAILGNYNGTPSKIVTILQGIKEKLGSGTEVVYEKAVQFTNDTIVQDGKKIKTDFTALANRVKDADAIVYAGGISPQLEGEEMRVNFPGFNGGDRTTIALPSVQTELLKALHTSGKPIVFVMLTGSAIATPWEAEHLPAIVNAWYGGQSAGTAVADVLFGDYNPAGRLPVTFYKSDSDLPAFDDYSMKNRTYRYFKGDPLFPFGYGLSYTHFVYSDLRTPPAITPAKNMTISARVTNSGKKDGEEVVQLYITPPAGDELVRALKGFQRIFLKAGESKIVSFTITPKDISVMNEDGKPVQMKGKISISIGGGQPDVKIKTSSNFVMKSLAIN